MVYNTMQHWVETISVANRYGIFVCDYANQYALPGSVHTITCFPFGSQVNLIPQDKPEDTYAAVAGVVRACINCIFVCFGKHLINLQLNIHNR